MLLSCQSDRCDAAALRRTEKKLFVVYVKMKEKREFLL